MPTLASPIQTLKGVTPEMAERFHYLGITTLQEALLHFPIRHEDWREVVPFDHLVPKSKVTVVGTLKKIQTRRAWRGRAPITEAVLVNDTKHELKVVWFNQPYLATWLKPGEHYFLSGQVVLRKGTRLLQQPTFQRVQAHPMHERLVPVYPTTGGLTQWQIRKVLRQAVTLTHLLTDPLPAILQTQFGLAPLSVALESIHFPKDPEDVATALRRLKFDELLAWQIAWRKAHLQVNQAPAPKIPFQAQAVREFVQSLPFELTPDQRQATWDILQDLERTEPMSRLVQGDVGSGKTVVAAIAAVNAIRAGWQVVLLAPTIVLAQQHATTLLSVLADQDFRIALLTGSVAEINGQAVTPEDVIAGLRENTISLIIATHAVLQPGIAWQKLGLVIVDEQQRFGVRQRQSLLDVTRQSAQVTPHFLSLTATPIPRTLALALAGDLKISNLRTKPPGRQPIMTRVIPTSRRKELETAIQATLNKKEQVYVITPLIEESDVLGIRAATTEHERLTELFPHSRVGLVHGNLAGDQRIDILEKFRGGELDILVSTTVIEVGIDVPNASLMIIEGAERFGLSQLHQLRGRIGRGTAASLCLLATDSDETAVLARLQRVADTNDGFAIADLDLEVRGAGDVYGVRQSGLPAWKLATLQDAKLFVQTRAAADQLLSAPPDSAEAAAIPALIGALPTTHRE